MIAAFITGWVMSFIGSMIPTGPIALIVLKRGLGRQKLSALSLVAGAAVAEATYALVAYLGINFALSRYPIQTSILRMIAGGILLAFAAICIFNDHPSRQKTISRSYPGANFLLGLSIAGLNPTFLITWAGAIAAARAAGLLSGIHAAPGFALGVIVGPILWFWVLLKILARHAEFLSPKAIKTIEKALPIALLILAGVILAQAVLPLLQHR